MKTLILDNYDSFTYNLFQYIAELGGNPAVFQNNQITLQEIKKGNYTHIIISPGPGSPVNKKDFGICVEVIKRFMEYLPILGVCLGHQGIIHALGGRVVKAPYPMHGKTSIIEIKSCKKRIANCKAINLFRDLPMEIPAMRYHSLIVERSSIPNDLFITAETKNDRLIMGIQHKIYPLYGIQFHPESMGTPHGKEILKNFLEVCENCKLQLKNLYDTKNVKY